MKAILVGISVLLFSSMVAAQGPPDPPPIQRIEKLEDKTADLEKRISRLEATVASSPKTTNEAVFGKPMPSPTGVKVAVGHTHTCSNGHTWDHTMDGGSHRCPFCGQSQYVVDSTPKVVTGSPVQSSSPVVSYQIVPYSSGGCANGQCDVGTAYSRPGFFRNGGFFRR